MARAAALTGRGTTRRSDMRTPNRGGHSGSRLERAMRGFVIRENIKHYRRLLEATADERERTRLHELLAEERQKERRLGDSARCDLHHTETLDGAPAMPNGASHDRHR
jgi:hypothetical protein